MSPVFASIALIAQQEVDVSVTRSANRISDPSGGRQSAQAAGPFVSSALNALPSVSAIRSCGTSAVP